MRQYSVGARSAGAGSATLPIGSLYAVASRDGTVREIGITNPQATGFTVGLCRLTTAGTPGSGLTEFVWHPTDEAADLTAFNTHTSTGPTLADGGLRDYLAPGGGTKWVFGGKGLYIPAGTANGIGIYVPTGNGQVCDFYFCWEE